jgi:hypothetical protein
MQVITALVQEGIVHTDKDIAVPWWSFAKTVLASAALVLVAQGRLPLDEPLPDQPFTLRQSERIFAYLANETSLFKGFLRGSFPGLASFHRPAFRNYPTLGFARRQQQHARAAILVKRYRQRRYLRRSS